MIEKFDAFISYKHAPRDNEVADQIQKGLERFRIPAKIRSEKGIQKIERIFRDKAELPITSSLDNNISYALEHSDFLIVICSHSTRLSGWVPREIEYFLKFHPMSHVLTVLAEGEPGEVIPEQLLHTTIVKTDDEGDILYDDQGEPVTEEVPLEPLSCDWRLPLRQARREELPRLAAAIIGCSYDELVMRARQYRRRQLTAALSVAGIMASVAIGYLLWSRAQIKENLVQAQINQSVFLANASARILEQDHDGVGAVQLAMAAALGPEGISEKASALSPEEAVAASSRPVTPEAIYALSNAIHAYEPVKTLRYPTKKYSMSSPVSDMAVDDDKKTLFLLDESGELGIFDILSQEKIYTRAFEDAFAERMAILPAAADQLLITDGFKLYLLDWRQDNILWTLPLWIDADGNEFIEHSASFTENNLYASSGFIWKDLYPDVAMALSPDKTLLAVDGGNDTVRLIDMTSGRETDRFTAGYESGTDYGYYENFVQKIIWSPDSSTVAAVLYHGMTADYVISVAAYEPASKKLHLFDTEEAAWEDLAFAGNDHLLLLTIGTIADNTASNHMQSDTGMHTALLPCEAQAFCFSLKDDRIRWQKPLPWDQPWEMAGSCCYASKEDYGREAAVFAVSNKGFALDMADGSLIASQEYGAPILKIEIIDQDMIYFFLSDSSFGILIIPDGKPENHEMSSMQDTGTPLNVTNLIRVPDGSGGALFLCAQKKCQDVIGFSTFKDPDGAALETSFENLPEGHWILADKLLVMADDKLTGLSLTDGSLIFEHPLDGAKSVISVTPGSIGTGTDQFALVLLRDDAYSCLLIDPETGDAKEFPLECRMAAARGGYLYGIENGSEENFGTIVKYSLSGQTYERIPVTGPSGDWLVDNKGFFLSPDGSQAALATNKDTLCRIDLQTGNCEPFKEEAANANYFIWSEDSSHYATISNTMINIHKADGTPVSQIPTGGRYYCFAQFEGDYLYVAYGNARLFRYRITDGQEEGVADIALYVNDKDNGNLTFTDEYLYLNAGSGTGRMSTIDLSQMKRINVVEGCCGYSPETNLYVVRKKVDDRYQYFTYKHYSLADLIKKGRDFAGGNEMTTEMQVEYGLQPSEQN